MLPRVCGAAALLAALLAPALAAAAENKEIAGDQTLGGDFTFDTFTVTATGKLHVPHLTANPDGGAPDGGWLHIRANKIIIAAGGLIEADGAGHVGVDGDNGQAPATTAGGGGKGATPGLPGGGGGFFGNGASGGAEQIPTACMSNGASSPGGLAFFDMVAKTPSLGAAGGAANVMPTTATAGGNGGGGIILEAAVVQIDGTITANGAKRFATGGVGPGGGSGGTIKIVTAMLSGMGKLEVRGGDGAHGNGSTNPANPIPANNGGGGSGGVVLLNLPAGMMAPASLTFTVTGGLVGDCTDKGADGAVLTDALPGGCVDLDGDGFTSTQCGGEDCDDTDGAIHPGVDEVCDGKDNDCNKSVDDGDKLCPTGTTCMNGACQGKPDAGSDAGAADAGAPPDHLEFGGGCALPATGGLAEGAAAAAAFALGTLALAAGRRPRRRGARRG